MKLPYDVNQIEQGIQKNILNCITDDPITPTVQKMRYFPNQEFWLIYFTTASDGVFDDYHGLAMIYEDKWKNVTEVESHLDDFEQHNDGMYEKALSWYMTQETDDEPDLHWNGER